MKSRPQNHVFELTFYIWSWWMHILSILMKADSTGRSSRCTTGCQGEKMESKLWRSQGKIKPCCWSLRSKWMDRNDQERHCDFKRVPRFCKSLEGLFQSLILNENKQVIVMLINAPNHSSLTAMSVYNSINSLFLFLSLYISEVLPVELFFGNVKKKMRRELSHKKIDFCKSEGAKEILSAWVETKEWSCIKLWLETVIERWVHSLVIPQKLSIFSMRGYNSSIFFSLRVLLRSRTRLTPLIDETTIFQNSKILKPLFLGLQAWFPRNETLIQ